MWRPSRGSRCFVGWSECTSVVCIFGSDLYGIGIYYRIFMYTGIRGSNRAECWGDRILLTGVCT